MLPTNMSKVDFRAFILARMKELLPIVFGRNEPSMEDAMAYFGYNNMLNKEFGCGSSYEEHPRNPFSDKFNKKTIDTKENKPQGMSMTKDEAAKQIIDELEVLSVRVFGKQEPILTDRMTFFAWANFLRRYFGVGSDYSTHPRNPWKDCPAPLDFDDYSQIRKLPVEVMNTVRKTPVNLVVEPDKKETQVLPVVEAKPIAMFFVVDKDSGKTVYQETEENCENYCAICNKDLGYAGFEVKPANINFVPRDKNKTKVSCTIPLNRNIVHVPKIPNNGNCGNTYNSYSTHFTPKPTVRTRVQEYLKKTQAAKTNEQ